jgi:hypothetical protein
MMDFYYIEKMMFVRTITGISARELAIMDAVSTEILDEFYDRVVFTYDLEYLYLRNSGAVVEVCDIETHESKSMFKEEYMKIARRYYEDLK